MNALLFSLPFDLAFQRQPAGKFETMLFVFSQAGNVIVVMRVLAMELIVLLDSKASLIHYDHRAARKAFTAHHTTVVRVANWREMSL